MTSNLGSQIILKAPKITDKVKEEVDEETTSSEEVSSEQDAEIVGDQEGENGIQ